MWSLTARLTCVRLAPVPLCVVAPLMRCRVLQPLSCVHCGGSDYAHTMLRGSGARADTNHLAARRGAPCNCLACCIMRWRSTLAMAGVGGGAAMRDCLYVPPIAGASCRARLRACVARIALKYLEVFSRAGYESNMWLDMLHKLL